MAVVLGTLLPSVRVILRDVAGPPPPPPPFAFAGEDSGRSTSIGVEAMVDAGDGISMRKLVLYSFSRDHSEEQGIAIPIDHNVGVGLQEGFSVPFSLKLKMKGRKRVDTRQGDKTRLLTSLILVP